MAYISLPEDYALIQLHDGSWLAAEVFRAFGPQHPEEGHVSFFSLSNHEPFSTKKQALERCQQEATRRTTIDERYYACLLHDEQYPERNAWYRDLIKEVTGSTPIAFTFDKKTTMSMFLPPCSCGWGFTSIKITQPTFDEALECAAEWAYNAVLHRQQCTGDAHESA